MPTLMASVPIMMAKLSSTTTAKEPVMVTLLDLTRHSDAELAAKARRVIARVDVVNTVTRGLRSAEPSQVAASKSVTIVVSLLELLNIPFGTALAVYGLWILYTADGARLFKR